MEVEKHSRLQVFGEKIYGSVYWIQQPETAEENDQGSSGGETQSMLHLRDDIIRQVLDKIPETKILWNCSLVSKNLASMVLDTKRVSLEIQSWRPACSCHTDPTIHRGPFSSVIRQLFNFLSPIKIPRFQPLMKWKCDTSGFIFVSAKALDRLSDDDNEEALGCVENAIRWTMTEAIAEAALVKYHFMDAMWRLVTDSTNEGQVVLDEDVIMRIRDRLVVSHWRMIPLAVLKCGICLL